MRSKDVSVLVVCLVILSASAAIAKEAKAKPTSKKPVLTLPPPTAEWPEFPPVSKPESASQPSTTAASSPRSEPHANEVSATPSASGETPSTGLNSPDNSSAIQSPGAPAQEASAAPVSAAQMEPHKRPIPEGYESAAALYKQKKFPQAAKAFEAIIQKGTANVDTHLSLAYCYLLQRLYSKAVKEFEWVEKYGKNSMTLQRQCGSTAVSLRSRMAGVCPMPCLKANDPRWRLRNDGQRWLVIQSSRGGMNISQHHIGEYVAIENGMPVLKGRCPVCEGAGQIPRLKDGDPPPRL